MMQPLTITQPQLNHYLNHRQGFDWANLPARELIGLYGTAPTCYLSMLARDPNFLFPMMDAALYETRSLVRMRAMRSSQFLVSTTLLPVVFQATKDKTQFYFRQILEKSGVSKQEYSEIAERIGIALEAESLQTGKLKSAVAPLSPQVDYTFSYLIGLLAAEGCIIRAKVRGGWKSDLYEYARFDRWLPSIRLDTLTLEEARVILAREYFDSYGPATPDDFRWWSGLNKPEADSAIAALDDELVPLAIQELPGDYSMLANRLDDLRACPDEFPTSIILLPVWDAYLMAYKSRERYLVPVWREYVYDKAGNSTSAVLLNGKIGGVWDMQENKKSLILKVALFEQHDPSVWRELQGWLERLTQIIGCKSATLVRCDRPPLLTQGSQNLFHSPLKDVPGEIVFSL